MTRPGTHHLQPGVSFLAQGTPRSQATLAEPQGPGEGFKPAGQLLHPLTDTLSERLLCARV